MNKHMKLIIFSLLLIICLSMTQASFASDASDILSDSNDTANQINELNADDSQTTAYDKTSTQVNELKTEDQKASSEINIYTNNGDLESSDENAWFIGDNGYSSLDDAVNNANEGDTITGLEGIHTITTPISIDKELTITSKNTESPILSGNNSNALFNITINGKLTLKNIILSNGSSQNGGAISNEGTLIVENCTFTNNIAEEGAGAIYSIGNLTIKDSSFIKNKALYSNGGAIWSENGTAYINNSIFSNNYGNFNGGNLALQNTSAIVNNSIFTNTSSNNMAGSIFIGSGSTLNLENTIIANSTTGIYGGGISNLDGVMNIKNCTFTGNIGKKHYSGGAIYTQNMNVCCNISDSRFINNLAGSAGAIRNGYDSMLSLYNCLFDNNTAYQDDYSSYGTGGAISNTGNMNITSCNFTNNIGLDGGAICNFMSDASSTVMIIKDSIFDSNKVTDTGASIYNQESTMKIYNSTFKNTQACFGGAVLSFDGSLTIDNSNFINCSGNNLTTSTQYRNLGGAIALMKATALTTNTITNNNFTNCQATRAGAIYALSKIILTGNRFTNILSDNETLVLEDVVTIGNNTFENSAVGFKISTNKTELDLGENAYINAELIYPEYYDADLLDKTSFAIYCNNAIVTNSAGANSSFIPMDRGTNQVYLIANISYKSSNIIEFELEKYNDNLVFNYTVNGNTANFTSNITDEDNNVVRTGTLTYTIINATGSILYEVSYEYDDNPGFLYSNDFEIGLYNITITYRDNQYKNIIYNTRFLVGKLSSSLNASYSIDSDNRVIIYVTANPEETSGNITLSRDDTDIYDMIGILDKSKTTFSLSDLELGEHEILLTYNGDEMFDTSTARLKFTLGEIAQPDDIRIIANDMSMTYKDGSKFTVQVLNYTSPMANQNIVFTFDNKNHTVKTDSNGIASLAIDALPSAKTIIATLMGTNISSQNTIKINDWDYSKVSISVKDVKTTYSQKSYYVVTVKYDGKAVQGLNINLHAGSKSCKISTNANGQASFALNALTAGTYEFAVYVGYNDVFKAAKSKVTVSKMKAHFTKASKTVKKGKYFKLTVLDKNNKALKSQKVKIKIKGKTYTAKTNSKGVAKLKLKFKKGKYKISYYLASNNKYSSSKVSKKIRIK